MADFRSDNLAVDFSGFELDLTKKSRSRLLNQFYSKLADYNSIEEVYRQKFDLYVSQGKTEIEAANLATSDIHKELEKVEHCVLAQVMNAIAAEFQEFYDAAMNILKMRSLELAEGVNLQVLGDIVGQPNYNLNFFMDYDWFTPDHEEEVEIEGQTVSVPFGPDDEKYPAWVRNAIGDVGESSDSVYRSFILAKIFKNHLLGASSPEILSFIRLFSNSNTITLGKTSNAEDMEEVAVFSNGDDLDVPYIKTLMQVISNNRVNLSYLVPLPPEVKLVTEGYYRKSGDEFVYVPF